jgi:hypothetical protein
VGTLEQFLAIFLYSLGNPQRLLENLTNTLPCVSYRQSSHSLLVAHQAGVERGGKLGSGRSSCRALASFRFQLGRGVAGHVEVQALPLSAPDLQLFRPCAILTSTAPTVPPSLEMLMM